MEAPTRHTASFTRRSRDRPAAPLPMVLHGGSGDGAKAGAKKSGSAKHAKPTSAALAAGLREAQRERGTTAANEKTAEEDHAPGELDHL